VRGKDVEHADFSALSAQLGRLRIKTAPG
jgi:hypothetical protein